MAMTEATGNEGNELVRALPRMRRFAVTLTRNSADADDLVQEACERVLVRARQRPPHVNFESWIYTIMRNMWIDEIRKRKVRTGKGTVDAEEQNELSIPASGERAVYARELVAVIQSMPDGLSAVFLLVNVEGYSYREAAAILAIPIGTVMSRLSAARLRFAALAGLERKAA